MFKKKKGALSFKDAFWNICGWKYMISRIPFNIFQEQGGSEWGTNAIKIGHEGFPGGVVVKNPPANTGDTGLSPGPGRSHMPRNN